VESILRWNLDSGLEIKGKAVKYTSGFLEKSCKNIQNIVSEAKIK
jgi:hypothetical protein